MHKFIPLKPNSQNFFTIIFEKYFLPLLLQSMTDLNSIVNEAFAQLDDHVRRNKITMGSDFRVARQTAAGRLVRKGRVINLGFDRLLSLIEKYGSDQFEVTLDIKMKTGRPDVTGQPEV
jgi:hypothetical protein